MKDDVCIVDEKEVVVLESEDIEDIPVWLLEEIAHPYRNLEERRLWLQ